MIDISKVYTSNGNGDFVVANYINYRNIEIEFVDTGYRTIVQGANLIRGTVKDYIRPSICGVGFIGVGPNKAVVKNKATKQYKVWSNMIERCYHPNAKIKYPTYKGVTVCGDWHNFQNFADWFNKNYIDGFELDKDIAIDGNDVYCPNACLFVSKLENVTKARAKNYKFKNPEGAEVKIYNLTKFCRKNNLSQGNMRLVMSGKRSHHKGWSFA